MSFGCRIYLGRKPEQHPAVKADLDSIQAKGMLETVKSIL